MYAYIDEYNDHVWDVYEYDESYDYLIDNWHPHEELINGEIFSWAILHQKEGRSFGKFNKDVESLIDMLNMVNIHAGLIDPDNCGLTLEAKIKYFGIDRFICDYDCNNCGIMLSYYHDPLELFIEDEITF